MTSVNTPKGEPVHHMLLTTHPHPPLQTTFRVGLALLTGVERELLTADFEQVGAQLAALVCACRSWRWACCLDMCCAASAGSIVTIRQLAAPTRVYLLVSTLVQCAIAMVSADCVRNALQILGVLNAKWFPAFSRSPVELLKTAMSFSVSSRLAKYEAEYKSQ